MASALLMPMLTTAMAAMAHTDMASAPLMLMPTTDSATAHTDMASAPLMLMLTTDLATAPTDTASKLGICSRGEDTSGINQNYTLKPKVPRTDMIREDTSGINQNYTLKPKVP